MGNQTKPIRTFKVNNEVYDVPADKVDAFLQKAKNAIEVRSFVNDKDTFDVPLPKVETFLKKLPGAKPLYDYAGNDSQGEIKTEIPKGSVTVKQDTTPVNEIANQSFPDSPENKPFNFWTDTGVGRGLYAGAKGAAGSMATAFEDATLKVNELAKNDPIWGGFDKYQEYLANIS